MRKCYKCEFKKQQNGCSLDYARICTQDWNNKCKDLDALRKYIENDLRPHALMYKKVLERVREDISSFCVECQDKCKECTVGEIKTQIDEVLK